MAPERKWIDKHSNRAPFSSTFVAGGLNLVALHQVGQGLGANERVGTKINIESYNIHANIRVSFQPFNTGTDVFSFWNNPIIRYGVVYDRQPDRTTFEAQFDFAELFTDFWGHINKDNKDRFFVISDKYTTLGALYNALDPVDPGPPPAFGPPISHFTEPRVFIWKEYKDVDLSVIFSDVDELGIEPLSGALWAFLIKDKNSPGGNLLWDYDMRTTFTDAM